MLRIAICDDDSFTVQAHARAAEGCLKQCGSMGEITSYTHSGNLLYDITEDRFFFDLILLDIEMPGNSGMELAEKISPFLPNVKIIFITSHAEYAIDAFELSIFRFVPKNDVERRLPAAIRDAIKLIELGDGKAYTIKTNSRLEKYRSGKSSISNGMEKTPVLQLPAVSPRCGKACSKFMRSWQRKNLSLLIADASST